jgi:hypothetical protein
MVGCLDSVGVLLPILKGQVADRQLLQHFSGNFVIIP